MNQLIMADYRNIYKSIQIYTYTYIQRIQLYINTEIWKAHIYAGMHVLIYTTLYVHLVLSLRVTARLAPVAPKVYFWRHRRQPRGQKDSLAVSVYSINSTLRVFKSYKM